jgi:hypothetical protein
MRVARLCRSAQCGNYLYDKVFPSQKETLMRIQSTALRSPTTTHSPKEPERPSNKELDMREVQFARRHTDIKRTGAHLQKRPASCLQKVFKGNYLEFRQSGNLGIRVQRANLRKLLGP